MRGDSSERAAAGGGDGGSATELQERSGPPHNRVTTQLHCMVCTAFALVRVNRTFPTR